MRDRAGFEIFPVQPASIPYALPKNAQNSENPRGKFPQTAIFGIHNTNTSHKAIAKSESPKQKKY